MKRQVTLEYERRKRRRELIVALVAVLVIGVLFYVESRLARSAEDIPFAGHLLIFGLLFVVTLLLILVIFFLIRNFFKLIFERRRKVLGSHLKTTIDPGICRVDVGSHSRIVHCERWRSAYHHRKLVYQPGGGVAPVVSGRGPSLLPECFGKGHDRGREGGREDCPTVAARPWPFR